MSVEDNKQVALKFFESLSTGDIDGALDLIDEDVSWWLAGKPDQFEIAGTKTKAEFAEMLRSIETAMPGGIRLTITGVTAEDDRVAVEMNADGVSVTGLQSMSYADNLLLRAADVTLKERRPLVLLVRETPLHLGHLRLLTQLAELGATIMPPMPAFYCRPETLEDVIDQTVARALDQLDIEPQDELFDRWDGPTVRTERS